MTKYNKKVSWLVGSYNIFRDEDDYLTWNESQISVWCIEKYIENKYDQMGLKDKEEKEYSFYV